MREQSLHKMRQNAHDRAEERSGTKLQELGAHCSKRTAFANATASRRAEHPDAQVCSGMQPAFYGLLISLVLSLFLLRREMSAITMMKVNTNGGLNSLGSESASGSPYPSASVPVNASPQQQSSSENLNKIRTARNGASAR